MTASAPRRLRPGTRAHVLYGWCDDYVNAYKEVLSSNNPAALDAWWTSVSRTASFPFQEHVSCLSKASTPISARSFVRCPSDIPDDRLIWQYEMLRFFTSELNQYTVAMDETCTAEAFPVMKATDEWIYLCASHPDPRECSAPDYMLHTLDGTSAYLCASKWFPSRMSVSKNAAKAFGSIARRIYRIFAHAWFHHREAFVQNENETHLCERFTRFCEEFNLVSGNLLIVPAEAAFSRL